MELLPLPEGPKRMVQGADSFMPAATWSGPSLASTRRVWCRSNKLRPPVAAAVDEQEGKEGEGDEGGGGKVRVGVTEFLDVVKDGDGEGAGDAGDVAADHEDYAEFADGVGEGEDGRGEEGHAGKRKGDAAEDGPGGGAEDAGDFEGGAIDGGKGDDQRLHGEGQAVDHRADEEAGEGEGQGMPQESDEGAAEGGGGAKTDEKVEAENSGRKDEGQGYGSLEDPPRHAVAASKPSRQRCGYEEQEQRGETGQAKRQAECGEVHGGASLACTLPRSVVMALVGGIETELGKALLNAGAGEPSQKFLGCVLILRGLEDDAALADLGVAVGSEKNVGAEVSVVGRVCDGERDDGDLGIAGFGELGGLADVFSDDKFARDLVREAEAGESLFGGEAVGSMLTVGYGNLLYFGTREGVESEWLRRRVFACPEDEDAMSVGNWSFGRGETRGDKLLRVNVVGGEEDVLGVAVGDLLGKSGGGAEGCDDLDAGSLLILCCEGRQDWLQIRSGGDVELFGRLRMRGVRRYEYRDKKEGGESGHSAGRERFTIP